MPLTPVPLTLQTIYADLTQQVYAAVLRPGSVYRRTIKGVEYLYAKIPVGEGRIDLFLGRVDDEAAAAKALAIEEEAQRAAERRRTVRMLRSRGLPGPSSELGRVLDALAYAGIFARGGVLVGTAAYQCYAPLVGHSLPSSSLMTLDADLAMASLILEANEQKPFEAVLKHADKTFTGLPTLNSKALSSRFRSASGFLVDLLTPQLRRTDSNPMPLKNLQAGAIPLQHLGWLLEQPVQAVALHGAGVPVTVPQPARYAAHKLIIAQKRTGDPTKRRKDLVQAATLIEALSKADPFALTDAVADAKSKGREGWARPLERSLAELQLKIEVA
jgi:hypothetical protein